MTIDRYKNQLRYSVLAWIIFWGFVVWLFLLAVGCQKDKGWQEIVGPLSYNDTRAIAWQWANSVGGVVYEVDNKDRSMGDVLSEYAFIIAIPAWTQVGKNQMITRSEGIVHEVVYKGADGVITAGRGNDTKDNGWVTEANYTGTVIATIYYKP